MICFYKSISIIFWFKSSQVKCDGSSIHGDDFTTSYSPTTWPKLLTSATLRSTIRCHWWRLLYYIVSIAIIIHVISIPCLLRISLVVTSMSYNDTLIMITIFHHLDWCFICYWYHRILIVMTLATIYFHQVYLLAPSLLSCYNINNHAQFDHLCRWRR